MSDFYEKTVCEWIEKYKYGPVDDDDNKDLVISLPTKASDQYGVPVTWSSAVAGVIEVDTVFIPAERCLSDTSVYIVVPGFGRAVLFSGQKIVLHDRKVLEVAIPGAGVYGKVWFVPSNDHKDVVLHWDLTVPWEEKKLASHRRMFPLIYRSKVQDAAVVPDSGVSTLEEASSEDTLLFNDPAADEIQKKVAASFIHDNVGAGNSTVKAPFLGGNSEGHPLEVSFLGIFELSGTILPAVMGVSAILYVKIPFAGRVQLVEIKGSLKQGIKTAVNLLLAQGDVKLYAKSNDSGRRDLWIQLDLNIKFMRDFKTDMRLFELPF